MHIFISDVHMTDAEAGGAVSDAQLASFVEDSLRRARETTVQLVLVGDIFDLLHSSKWAELWDQKNSAPWSGMSDGFKNFKGSYAEKQAIDIAKAIAARYAGLSSGSTLSISCNSRPISVSGA
jgi:UDP-2,3-diacylglucosamine pyrophosphatase LpxH